jgi:hypothetical protein
VETGFGGSLWKALNSIVDLSKIFELYENMQKVFKNLYYLASIWFIQFSSYSKMDRGFQQDFYKYRREDAF